MFSFPNGDTFVFGRELVEAGIVTGSYAINTRGYLCDDKDMTFAVMMSVGQIRAFLKVQTAKEFFHELFENVIAEREELFRLFKGKFEYFPYTEKMLSMFSKGDGCLSNNYLFEAVVLKWGEVLVKSVPFFSDKFQKMVSYKVYPSRDEFNRDFTIFHKKEKKK